MEILLIILISVLMGAINVASFFIGYKVGKETKKQEAYKVTEDNYKSISQLANLMSYTGEKGGE